VLPVDADLPAPEVLSAPDAGLAAPAVSEWTARVIGLTRWAGAGRKLTQAGRLTLTDARELVELLDTGDAIDPSVAGVMCRAKSSAELPESPGATAIR
jgi:hypothetical protein